MAQSDAFIVLADGIVVKGTAFGKKGTVSGELCFNTGMTGYQEIFTDPSYTGQILVMNNVHVGNYGVSPKDVESDGVKVKGIIGRNLEEKFSRFMADQSLSDFFEEQSLVAVNGVDTRALVTHVRNKGALNVIISNDGTPVESLHDQLHNTPNMEGLDLADDVSTKDVYTFGDENAPLKVAVMDFGVKKNILQCLSDRGAYLKVFNANTTFEEMETFQPDGYFISNGPGDPQPLKGPVNTIKKILEARRPFFGICLGNQLLALANGATTYKMHHGHRGTNHPVKNLQTGKCEITTQNHGFGVNPESLLEKQNIEVTHVNLNDGSIEGIKLKDRPAFSVQYHPESTPGPFDSRYLFDDFIQLIHSNKS